MSGLFPSRRRVARCVAALLFLALGAGCERPREDAAAGPGPEPPGAESAAPPPPGRPPLPAAPPVEPIDLDRMLAQGFSADEVLAAIRRRGVLRAPDPFESARIARWPDGARLVEAMTAPENVLMPKAAELHGRLLATGVNLEQAQNAANLVRAGRPPSTAYQTAYYQPTLQTNNRNRRQELSQRLTQLRTQYKEQTRRGETGAIVGMEIERLQRELDALPPC